MQRIYSLAALLQLLLLCIAAAWDDREDASGDWSGLRSRLEEEHGLHIDLDYTAESFNGNDDLSYRGNIDLLLTVDTSKLHILPTGTLFIYGQHAHGHGVSDELGLILPVSNLEAELFTQLSEFWFQDQIASRFRFRIGKQDANRDFGNPRFGGNFVNSSFGVLPGVPMPSFPAPGLGGAVFFECTKWLEVRSGLYEGTPQIGSIGESAFAEGAGVFTIASMVFHQNLKGHQSGVHQFGVWSHSGLNRSGLFAVYDLFWPVNPRNESDSRAVQTFLRGSWSPEVLESTDIITKYIGGGGTAHGFLGHDNTLGFGGGWVDSQEATETFLELFFKLREITWLTFEPDLQLYFTPNGRKLIFGIRTKLKL
jgi:porin